METAAQLEPWRSPEILEAHAKAYYENLPYHNWEHATSVRDRSRELAMVCFSQGIQVDLDVLEAAALYHDAGFYQKQAEYGVGTAASGWTKEHYSMYIAALDLQYLGMPDQKIEHVMSCIASTQADVDCTSIEGRILAQADIENVGGDPLVFLTNTLRLYAEAAMLSFNGRRPSLIEYARKSHDYLQLFLNKDLSLGQFDQDPETGRPILCARGIQNAKLLIGPPQRVKQWFEHARKAS